MINNDKFAKRLKIVLDYYQLSAATFAEKIKVQRSSISHLLSGRNKPSLDFVLKVLEEFKEVELYWFLNGKGSFPKNLETVKFTGAAPTLFSQEVEKSKINETIANKLNEDHHVIQHTPKRTNKSGIERIVIFYVDGTFEEYVN